MHIQYKQEIFVVTIPSGDEYFTKLYMDGFSFARVNGVWKHYTGGNLSETNPIDNEEFCNVLEERFQNIQKRYIIIEKAINIATELFPTDIEIEAEAESRYPVNTHMTPNNSPYVGSKITFTHGINWLKLYMTNKQ